MSGVGGGGGGVPRPQQCGWYKRRLPLIAPLPAGSGTQTGGIGGGPAALVVPSGNAERLLRTRRAIVVIGQRPGKAATPPCPEPARVVRSDTRREGRVFRTPLIAAKINVAGGVIRPWVLRRDFRREALVYRVRPFLKAPPPPVAGNVPSPFVVRFDRTRKALVFFVLPPLEAPVVFLDKTTWISWPSEARGIEWVALDRLLVWKPDMTNFLTKHSAETRQYTMDFSQLPELSSNSITSVTSVASNVLTVGASNVSLSGPAVGSNGKTATVWISGGQSGANYQIVFTVTVAGGTVLEEFGYLLVEDE